MIRNYIKIAWRNLVKKKTFSIINITGLSVSVAFCLLLFFYIRHEQSYDTFHTKKDRLFRLEMSSMYAPSSDKETKNGVFDLLSKNDEPKRQLAFPIVVGPDLKKTFPEIKNVVRFTRSQRLIKAGKEVYNESNIMYADTGFFTSFSFPLIKGNPATVLQPVQNVVLSASTARKYFGNEDAIGKTIELVGDSNQLYTVAGIAKDAPENSSIQFGIVIPLLSIPDYNERIANGFNTSSHLCMVELASHVNAALFSQKMNAWVKSYFAEYIGWFKDKDTRQFKWYLRPLEECHYSANTPWGHFTNARNSYLLACLAIIILLIASLNYILLTISNAAARSQEIGVRKVMGARRRWVILQFWIETQLTIALAVITGLLIASLFLPVFNTVLDTHIQLDYFSWKEVIPLLIAMCLALGIIAGLYPAWLLSKMKPVSILKSFQTFKINPRFSKAMVVLQYTACIILMIAAFVINRQMHFISNKDLGFDKEQVLIVKNSSWGEGDITARLRERFSTYAKSHPSISLYSAMSGSLEGGGNHNGFKLNGEQKWLNQITVDYDYFKMLGLQLVAGRSFSKDFPSDTIRKARACVVNETLFNMLGKEAKLGVFNEDIRSTIIGVVKDYHFEDLSKKIEPQQHVLTTWYVGSFMFKIHPGGMQKAITGIEKEWKQITGNYPFEYTFLDRDIAAMYEPEMRWQKTIQGAAFFAILIACMGLFGLSAINAVNRTKEIGIRKVLGATVKDIVASLSSGFLALVGISIIIAAPLATWVMNQWLENFAYRITISWWMLGLVGIVALLIALATVSFQAIKAAMANPVNSLRSE